MNLPPKLRSLIGDNPDLSSLVHGAIHRLQPILGGAELTFFPEYTEHGTGHVEDVLLTAVELMPDNPRLKFSDQDAAVFVIACLLHDCGLHITEDGFQTLLTTDIYSGVAYFNDRPWKELWERFLSEARRFDGRKLQELFGDSEPIRRPPSDKTKMTMRDRLLIGEFLRRHHSRLAHEIALIGMPGPSGTVVPILDRSDYLADLAGVVARSHSFPLRSFFGYLQTYYDKRVFKDVHALFLMILLRISDLLQLRETRAPKLLISIKKLKSPISQGEWKVHHCIRDIRPVDDPEAIFIDALPTEVSIFLRVKKWTDDLQDELDKSWAVLGEIYGRFSKEEFDIFGLKLRRIYSSLDDIENLKANIDYIPAKITFDAANPDLLKLLVAPLYGEKPEIGIRELLQNAIDAVRERKELDAHFYPDTNADVTIEIEEHSHGHYNLRISDRGVGMSIDVIQNYFLKAGASFRNSEAWKSSFLSTDGEAKVLRSGRFGVGALAAFLIGDTIEVSTRHYTAAETDGLTFIAKLDTAAINVLQKSLLPVGTTVDITVGENNIHKILNINDIEWDFYCLSFPNIVRKRKGAEIKQHIMIALESAKLDGWQKIDVTGYDSIYWSYVKDAPKLICNGIKVGNTNIEGFKLGQTTVPCPALLVMDPNGRLPLNLQRTGLTRAVEDISNVLQSSITEDLVIYSLACAPDYSLEECPDTQKLFVESTRRKNSFEDQSEWIWINSGWIYSDLSLAQEFSKKCILSFTSSGTYKGVIQIDDATCIVPVRAGRRHHGSKKTSSMYMMRELINEFGPSHSVDRRYYHIINPRFMVISEKRVATILSASNVPKYMQKFLVSVVHRWDGWRACGTHSISALQLADFSTFLPELSVDDTPIVAIEYELAQLKYKEKLLANTWIEMLGKRPIPANFAARRKAFPDLFDRFRDRIMYLRQSS
jgi:hypothetical protein